MITLEALQHTAATEKARYEELLKIFPPGTVNNERNDARKAYETASLCAEHMLQQGVDQALHIGPFHTFTPGRGQRVRVKKGAIVRSTHPKHPESGKVLKRSQVITVHNFDKGYITPEEKIRAGSVSWAGSGGYWCWTDITNVELLD